MVLPRWSQSLHEAHWGHGVGVLHQCDSSHHHHDSWMVLFDYWPQPTRLGHANLAPARPVEHFDANVLVQLVPYAKSSRWTRQARLWDEIFGPCLLLHGRKLFCAIHGVSRSFLLLDWYPRWVQLSALPFNLLLDGLGWIRQWRCLVKMKKQTTDLICHFRRIRIFAKTYLQ